MIWSITNKKLVTGTGHFENKKGKKLKTVLKRPQLHV